MFGFRSERVFSILAATILLVSGIAGCGSESKSNRTQVVNTGGAAAIAPSAVGPADCDDKVDNDGDGLIDYGSDPGCDGATDPSEVDPVKPACNDTKDNDGDGLTDFGEDPGCMDFQDDDEQDAEKLACEDGIDNDGDGAIDTQDDGCSGPKDNDESDAPDVPACRDGVDNDGDGDIDFPTDRGCGSPDGLDESGEMMLMAQPQCADGRDNDGDGFIDLSDPGCSSAGAPREDDPANRPQCSNGLDDDNNGIIDFPYDPGCHAAGDNEELTGDTAPLCGNELDDDGDGLVDFPNDPGCVGVGDRDETDPRVLGQCADMIDNDQDGVRDYPEDPGCASRADPVEAALCGPRRQAVKAADGQVYRSHSQEGTFEYEGSCGGRGGAENIFFYRLNRPVDALEITTNFEQTELETVIYVRRSCTRDDSEIACQRETLDEGTAANTLRIEEPARGDYYIFVDGVSAAQKPFSVRISEVPIAQCRNDVDDDMDGRIDYPRDPGCLTPEDRDEVDPEEPPVCFDNMDNDGDGLTDYPLDIGCRAASGRDEVDACGQGVRIEDFPFNRPSVNGTTAPEEGNECSAEQPCAADMQGGVQLCVNGFCRSTCINNMECPENSGLSCVNGTCASGNRFSGSCGGQNLSEKVYVYTNLVNANLTFKVAPREPDGEMGEPGMIPRPPASFILYARSDCSDTQSELACSKDRIMGGGNDDDRPQPRPIPPPGDRENNDGQAADDEGAVKVVVEEVAPGPVYVFVDTSVGIGGPFRLSVEVDRLPPGCSDQRDNDEDGFIDADDIGCADAEDEDELDDVGGLPVCYDGIDNDMDGLTDYPFDPGCRFKGGASEADPAELPQCSDGINNDDDEWVDFPDEPGCSSAGDDDEDDVERPQCRNSIDDDGDGYVDYPDDPGCSARGDLSEEDGRIAPKCFDEQDNDRDGLVDYPFDPGCRSAGDQDEIDPVIASVCSNGVDDDGDMIIDFPADPGCTSASDTDEEDPPFPRQCSDGRDNDNGNGTDWPEDPGCRFAADNEERLTGPPLARCSDGIDNDMDGSTDLADDGCLDARDNDESDPVDGHHCNDGIDNDEDGAIDWPDDEGCEAHGAECEQLGYGLCGVVCEDLRTNAQHCGRCNRVCDDGVECIEGSCGGLLTFQGIRENVPDIDLAGWEVCHTDLYGNSNTLVQTMLNNCNGEYVMLGCRRVNSNTWNLLAMGERDAVFRDTGVRNNNLNSHNGVDWYFSDSYSMGFVAQGSGVSRGSCDTKQAPNAELRMCWHTSNRQISSGYRCGANTLNNDNTWERAVWTSGGRGR